MLEENVEMPETFHDMKLQYRGIILTSKSTKNPYRVPRMLSRIINLGTPKLMLIDHVDCYTLQLTIPFRRRKGIDVILPGVRGGMHVDFEGNRVLACLRRVWHVVPESLVEIGMWCLSRWFGAICLAAKEGFPARVKYDPCLVDPTRSGRGR
uniref:Uncharacterized protein n=1 Tax=Antirrhinum hispanicum TaxID=49039 RepID=Q9AXC1_ANTHI|nr:hypothetical protein [Antirrhinum hispanicum]